MSSRESYLKMRGFDQSEGPHEKRFESFNGVTTTCSKYKDSDTAPPFSMSPSREYLEIREEKYRNDSNCGNNKEYNV